MRKFFFTLFVCLMCAFASATVYTWTGSTDSNWSTSSNWTPAGVPGANDDVKIPAGCAVYPVATNGAVCKNIYLESGARLGDQYKLTYEKAFVDITIPTNRYVRVTSPLQNTYSGDWFAYWQCHEGDGSFGNFEESSFSTAVEGNQGTGYNRAVNNEGGQTYISMFVTTTEESNYHGNLEMNSVISDWQDPTSALATNFQVAEGFDIWMDGWQYESADDWGTPNKENVTFHFPSKDATYNYYQENGSLAWAEQTGPAQTPRGAGHGKFAYHDENQYAVISRPAGSGSQMYAVGNPALSYMDIKKFILTNVEERQITPFLYKQVQGDYRGSEVIYYANPNNQTVPLYTVNATSENEIPAVSPTSGAPLTHVAPCEGFRVMAGSAKIYTVEPSIIGNYAAGSPSNPTSYYTYAGVPVHKWRMQGFTWEEYNPTKTVAGDDPTKEFNLSITATDNPNKVIIANFVERGSVEAEVHPENNTLVIKNGSSIMQLDNSWNNYRGATGQSKILRVFGCKNGKNITYGSKFEYKSDHWIGVYRCKGETYRVENLGADVVINYTINGNNVTFDLQNAFAIYSNEFLTTETLNSTSCAERNYSRSNTPIASNVGKDGEEAEAFFVYNNLHLSKTNSTTTTGFILPAAEGVYRSNISNVRNISLSAGNFSGIEIERVNGSYDHVLISKLFGGQAGSSVIGKISRNGAYYDLTINGGQLVSAYDQTFAVKNYYIYSGLTANNATYRDLTGTPIVLRWNGSAWTQTSGKKFVQLTTVTDVNSYYRNNTWTSAAGGAMLGNPDDDSPFQLTRTGSLPTRSNTTDIQKADNDNSVSLLFTSDMFTANLTAGQAAAPKRTASSEVNPVATIVAGNTNHAATSLLVKSDKASAAFSIYEDAPLFDVADAEFCLGTIAGSQLVGVNVFNEFDTIPLYLTESATLTFKNISALGDSIAIFDAETQTTTLLADNDTYNADVIAGEEAGRYFLVNLAPKAPSVETGLNNVQMDWRAVAYSPASGMINVNAGAEARIELYNAAGQLVGTANAQTVSFTGLQSGAYVVSATKGNQKQTIKVIVY